MYVRIVTLTQYECTSYFSFCDAPYYANPHWNSIHFNERNWSVSLTNVQANCDKAVIYIRNVISTADGIWPATVGYQGKARFAAYESTPLKSAGCGTVVRKTEVSRQLSWSGDCERCQSGCRSARAKWTCTAEVPADSPRTGMTSAILPTWQRTWSTLDSDSNISYATRPPHAVYWPTFWAIFLEVSIQ